MICLGIESTAHTYGIGIINDKGKILADVRDTYTTKKGGLIPTDAAKHHREVKDAVFKKALECASLEPWDIDVIAFSQSPGLAPSLIVGLETAKELAIKWKKPVVGVNHCIAHLEIGKLLTEARDPVYVFTSGANTQIIAFEGGKYRIFGEALSIALGNALDKFGREVGLGFPPGPKIEELAKKGNYIELPYIVKGMDVEFSGIITHAIHLFKKGVKVEDLCFSLQENMFAMVVEITERAMAHTGKKEALLIGGVAANNRFCKMMDIMCNERDAKFFACPMKYSGDNATMIAWLGILKYGAVSGADITKLDINPYERTDEVDIIWK